MFVLAVLLMPVLAVLGAAPNQGPAVSSVQALPAGSMAAASPEASVRGVPPNHPPQMANLNMMAGIPEAITDVIKGAMTPGGNAAMNPLAGFPGLSGMNSILTGGSQAQAAPPAAAAAAPAVRGFPMGGMMNPLSMLMGGRGSPFGMMVPGMMMNMMENMMEMFSF